MLDLISEGILNHLNSSGLDVQDIDFKQLVDRQTGSTMRPKVNVSIDSGAHQKITMNTYKQIPVVSLFLCVQNLRSERESRFAAYKLIDAIVQSLILEKMALDLQDPLTPTTFQNVTDEAFAGIGISLYQINFSCSFNYTKEFSDNIDTGEIASILNTFWLESGEESQSLVNLSDVDGGNAYYSDGENIFGGNAAANDYIEEITGGDAVNE